MRGWLSTNEELLLLNFLPLTALICHENPATTYLHLYILYVSLKIYNVLGQLVTTLVDGRLEAGEHVLSWNAADVPTGVYFYRLKTESFAETRKLIFLK